MKFPAGSLWTLSGRVVSGEVVFFIGAGFSRDSEGNTAERLILRLLVRFDAMTSYITEEPLDGVAGAAALKARSSRLREVLRGMFKLGKEDAAPLATWDNAKILGESYFAFNDWVCSAFTALLEDYDRIGKPIAWKLVDQALRLREEKLLRPPGGEPLDRVPLDRPDFESLLKLLPASLRGKALFLDTMGFANEKIMGGPRLGQELELAPGSWRDKILDRHHVLARLAREGLCPAVLTTNYDLLLEWAYRLSGLQPGGVKDPRGLLPPTMFQSLVRISEAEDFFSYGGAHRAALITKIHGCADVYRDRKSTVDSWRRYLPSLVFTFREIQNWREDAWSRDFLQTLLRTRTLVFCGYSTVDPVVHDTIRTVYEEMTRKRGSEAPAKGRSRPAPAYYMGLADAAEFYGMEILRAASHAMGEESPALTDHPNYLRFFRRQDTSFPRMDELMVWLFHLVFRRCQLAALATDLRRIVTLLLGHPVPEEDLRAARRSFLRLVGAEVRMSWTWDERPEHRPQLERITGWTDRFQVGLLRELALAETVLRNGGPGTHFETLRTCPWYFPALERTDWTAWTTIVELAARRMIAIWRGKPDGWRTDAVWVRPGAERHPTILFAEGERRPTPVELSIRLNCFERARGLAGPQGAVRQRHLWELVPESIPWHAERSRSSIPGTTPSAAELWRWAKGRGAGKADVKSSERWLGGSDADERRRRRSA